MAKKKGKLSPLAKVMIICGILIVVNVVFLVMRPENRPVTIKQAIDKAIEDQADSDPTRREQRRLVLAVNDFMSKNEGKVPQTLDELVPTYFDEVPLDPVSKKAFLYRIRDGRPEVISPLAPPEDQRDPLTDEELKAKEEEALIASLSDDAVQEVAWVYDPAGKRDPFKPFDLNPPSAAPGEGLLCCEVSQFRLASVLLGLGEPIATVETQDGKGYIIRKDTKIGVNGGRVVEILENKVLILEEKKDWSGIVKTETKELVLRTPL